MTSVRATCLLASVVVSAFTSVTAQNHGPVTGAPRADERAMFRPGTPVAMAAAARSGTSIDKSTHLHMRIVFSRSAEQQAALEKFEAEILDRRSTHYKEWITPQQYGNLFGPDDADVEAVIAWLQSHGFSVSALPPARTDLSFSGTVRQAEDTFHTSLHSYQIEGLQFYTPISEPVIPGLLKSTVAGIAGLSTFRPMGAHANGPALAWDPGVGRWEVSGARNALVERGLPASSAFLAITPADAATIYNAPNPLLNANATSRPAYTGTGVTIGVVSDAAIRPSLVASYRARFLGDHTAPAITSAGGVPRTEDAAEGYIGAELAAALAPGASIHIYTAADLFDAIEQALSENSVDILNVDFGACAAADGAERRLVHEWWAQAAAQGITVTVPASSTSEGCQGGAGAANVFATSPYNIAVGGTDTQTLANGFSPYVNDASSPERFYRLGNSYIPESGWSEAPRSDKELSAATQIDDGVMVPDSHSMQFPENCGAAGVLQTCQDGAKPAWQWGKGLPPEGWRSVPDVSLLAGQGMYRSAWAVCADGPTSGGSPADCTVQSDGRFPLHSFGGPSTGASVLAGMLALVQEKTGGRLGQAAAEIYGLFNGPNSAKIFHRSRSGDSPSSRGTDASNGYNRVTGLGSVDATELVKYWGSAVGTGAATVTVTPSVTTINSVTGFTVGVTVAGNLGTPAGTVVLQSGSFNSGTQTLSAGSFTFHIAPGALAVGSDTLTVSYSGDSNYASATGTGTISVTQTTPTITVTPSTHTLNSNAPLNVVATLTGGGGVAPTGTVTLSGGGYTSAAQTLANGTYTFAIPAFSLTAGSVVLSVSYAGDSLYAAATGSTTVTVTKSGFTLTATDLTLAAGATTNNASHVTVTPSGSYTGTVSLTAAVTASPAGAVSAPIFTGSSVAITSGPATGFITVATMAAPAARRGPPGIANGWFGAAGGTAIAAVLFWVLPGGRRRWRAAAGVLLLFVSIGYVAIGCGGGSKKTPTVTVKPSQASIKPSDTLSVTVTVAGAGSATPTGTVTLTTGSFTTFSALNNGGATLSIPANTLTAGQSTTMTASYSGDNHYLAASGSATVSVLTPGTTAGVYTVTVTGTGNDAGNTTATTTFTLTVQ
jgi:hypothetical protein